MSANVQAISPWNTILKRRINKTKRETQEVGHANTKAKSCGPKPLRQSITLWFRQWCPMPIGFALVWRWSALWHSSSVAGRSRFWNRML